MANTLATRKQSAAIRDRMQQIRNALPADVDVARASVRQLSDWRYHMRKRPWPVLAVAAVVGYWMVPAKQQPPERVIVRGGRVQPADSEPVAKKSLLSGAVAALMTVALRSGTSLATRHLSEMVMSRTRPRHGDLPRY